MVMSGLRPPGLSPGMTNLQLLRAVADMLSSSGSYAQQQWQLCSAAVADMLSSRIVFARETVLNEPANTLLFQNQTCVLGLQSSVM